MRIAVGLDIADSIDTTLARARELRDLGVRSLWSSQIFGPDTLTALALIGREIPELDLGTAVVPVQPRHPAVLAAQARTVQEMIGGRLTLGVGLSHQVVVEGLWGLSFDRPARYMREYLDALAPLLRGEPVTTHGEMVSVTATGPLGPREVRPPGLVVAALGERMLRLAGALADGTVLWMTGRRTIESHIVPVLRRAAEEAGRPAPRVVCSLPVCVSTNRARATEVIDHQFAIYPTLPSYAAMLEREGATHASDIAIVGSEEEVREGLARLAEAGVTEFSAAVVGDRDERAATLALVASMAS